uniref:Putative translocon-associated complex trap alpha subunit n=1 Tax=Ixodes scapularis TaxID=6945 RepID=A0A4D5RVK8_IXOSC
MFSRYMLLVLLIVPLATLFQQNGAFAQADDDDEDVVVEDSAQADQKDAAVTEPEDDGSQPLKPSPDGDTFLLFTKPQGFQSKLPAGKEVHFLVGFTNKGSKDFVLDTMDASFPLPHGLLLLHSELHNDWLQQGGEAQAAGHPVVQLLCQRELQRPVPLDSRST